MTDIETYINAAKQHGEDDDPDHEVGDLQEYLRVAFELLTPAQRLRFAAHPTTRETLAMGLGEDDDEPLEPDPLDASDDPDGDDLENGIDAAQRDPFTRWVDAVNEMGWNDESQIRLLEGFLLDRQLFADFARYAEGQSAAEKAETEEVEAGNSSTSD